ncbi:Acetyltransferase (GNAT) family protein [Nocardioides terrae]|uniref:Acetyltransferase (GNAT) family protein n=1 Tax=Nocardioides terrae TaxID=574651 RepID=A0A1I1LFT8_9ACTN|nr:GNAT family N-acetyltransferase [Nocardioides terrae]SFC71826.1 Acetyltransferase (GNAT) family protein [Nocardioides terrae]
MLWRVRTTLPDSPGTLALLAQRCGDADVNILRLQIFPGVEDVTDEIVLSTDDSWSAGRIVELVSGAGGRDVVAQPSTEAALEDQPTRYVRAARATLDHPMHFPEIVAQLFDAEAEPTDPGVVHDTMEMVVGDVQVQVHRTAPFTPTERARGAAMADLVNDRLARTGHLHAAEATTEPEPEPAEQSPAPLGTPTSPAYVVEDDSISAYVEGVVVGTATLGATETHGDGTTALDLDLDVEAAWQRRGIGTRLLLGAGRIARTRGADELLLTTAADNDAVLPMVLGAGLRGRIRMAGDQLTVRVSVGGLKPLAG